MLICNNCRKELTGQQKKFCCTRCAGLVNSPGRKHTLETKQKISIGLGGNGNIVEYKVCLFCGKDLKTQKKFCDNTCKVKLARKQKIEKWLNGEIDGTSTTGHASYVKHYLLEKYSNKCSICGWGEINPFTKRIPLEVEHIDGNAYNNGPLNVTLLCPNCHSLTATYKGANKDSGRKYRKKYK